MIKLLVMDVDGTLTDGMLYIGENGEIMKAFNVKDGYAVAKILPMMGIHPVIISGRISSIVERRASELGIVDLIQGCDNKSLALNELITRLNFSFTEVGYIGDDLNDLDAMRLCAFRACPMNAVKEIKEICHFISQKDGGQGAIRDVIDFLYKEDSM